MFIYTNDNKYKLKVCRRNKPFRLVCYPILRTSNINGFF